MGRSLRLDGIRMIAIIGAIMIHMVHEIYSRPDFLGGASWWLAAVINSFSRVSIPLFIMASGCLMLRKGESLVLLIRRIFLRLLVPLIGWTEIYYIFDILVRRNDDVLLRNVIKVSLTGGYGHLYFLVIMIGLYITLPLLKKLIGDNNSFKFVIAFLLFGAGWGLVENVVLSDLVITNSFNYFMPYIGYFLAGYWISNKPSNKITKKLLVVMFAFSWLAGLIWGYKSLEGRNLGIEPIPAIHGEHYSDDYLSVNVMVMALSSFSLLYWFFPWNRLVKSIKWLGRLIYSLSRLSYSMYLVHIIVILMVDKTFYTFVEFASNGLVGYLMKRLLLSWIFIIIAAFVLFKTPILKVIVGEPLKSKK